MPTHSFSKWTVVLAILAASIQVFATSEEAFSMDSKPPSRFVRVDEDLSVQGDTPLKVLELRLCDREVRTWRDEAELLKSSRAHCLERKTLLPWQSPISSSRHQDETALIEKVQSAPSYGICKNRFDEARRLAKQFNESKEWRTKGRALKNRLDGDGVNLDLWSEDPRFSVHLFLNSKGDCQVRMTAGFAPSLRSLRGSLVLYDEDIREENLRAGLEFQATRVRFPVETSMEKVTPGSSQNKGVR